MVMLWLGLSPRNLRRGYKNSVRGLEGQASTKSRGGVGGSDLMAYKWTGFLESVKEPQ